MSFWSKIFGGSKAEDDGALRITIHQAIHHFGFRASTAQDRYGDFAPVIESTERMANTPEGITAYMDLMTPYLREDFRLPWGETLASHAHEWAPPGDAAHAADSDAFVDGARQVYESRPSALSAAIYAFACNLVGWRARGQDYKVSPEGAATLQDWGDRGWDIGIGHVNRTLDGGQGLSKSDVPLLASVCSIALTRGSPEALTQVFGLWEQVDPTDLAMMTQRAYSLLPRWYGSAEELEQYARSCMEATRPVYGAGAYGYIYGWLCRLADFDIEDTGCDIDLADQGMKDLRAYFPCNYLHNMHAQLLSWGDREERVLEIFNEGLKVIDYRAWTFADEDNGMRNAVVALAVARNEAAGDNIHLIE
ncbi:hypothetical protein [Brevundimonas diminuta]|uniref:hypothetical protein n=1 Tax=Brevundimonas diminuta TaxID=293 RepID=UPI003CFFFD09